MPGEILATSADGTVVYQQLTQKYIDDTCEVTRKTLFTTGNVCQAIGVSQDPEALKELDKITQAAIQDGVTVIAVDKNTDKVVGICVNKILVKSKPFYENFRNIFKNPRSQQIIEFIVSTDNICNLFEHCRVESLVELLFLGTLPEYRKKGIAKKLCEISVDLAQKLYRGINVKQPLDGNELSLEPVPEIATAIFTSFISQKIGRELGFEVAAEKSSKKLEIMGKIFENSSSETDVIQVQYKRLSKNE